MIPNTIQNAIEEILSTLSQEKLAVAYSELSEFYRNRNTSFLPPLKTIEQRMAYLAVRFPATFTAVHEVLKKTKEIYPLSIKTLLDLGSGPGTAFFAAKEIFPEITSSELIERDTGLINLGKKLSSSYKNISWHPSQLQNLSIDQNFDLIIASYSLGELTSEDQIALINKVWPHVNSIITIIEPGTPKGFETIRRLRAHLIQLGAFLVAPCPHALACPMPEDDWCHFSVRLPRTKTHRLIKQASLSYEDEKFSYISFSKKPIPLPASRVLRHPGKHPGHINFTLCTPFGLQRVTCSKKEGDLYKQAKKKEWGDTFERNLV